MLCSVVERHHACYQDDHIENKRHVHVDVDHAADHFTPSMTKIPVISDIVVDPKGHSGEEEEMGKDEVKNGDGGDGRRAGPYDVNHQTQAYSATEQDYGVDGQQDIVVLRSFNTRGP